MRSTPGGIGAVCCALLVACHPAPEPTPEVELPPVERATVEITPPAAGGILSVPKAAKLTRAGVPGVFVVREGRARFHMVKFGRAAGKRIEALSGLHGGETLVIGDLETVHDGSPLRPLE